jgi:hypothetical protein
MFSAITLVVLETKILSKPPSGFWFLLANVIALVAFVWANTEAFKKFRQPYRGLAITSTAIVAWLLALVITVTLGVNLKFALGGRV